MDNIDDVKNIANTFQKWVETNKGICTIEILPSFEFNTIIVLHNLFIDTKFENSWEFLDDIIYLLDMYSDNSKEDWQYMIDFWYNDTDILNEVKKCQ